MSGARARRSIPGTASTEVREKLTIKIRTLLADDEELVQHRREMTQAHLDRRETCEVCGGSGDGAIASEQDCAVCGGAGVIEARSDRFESRLRDWCNDLVLDNSRRDIQCQLLSIALDLVDWESLAEAYIFEESERPGRLA